MYSMYSVEHDRLNSKVNSFEAKLKEALVFVNSESFKIKQLIKPTSDLNSLSHRTDVENDQKENISDDVLSEHSIQLESKLVQLESTTQSLVCLIQEEFAQITHFIKKNTPNSTSTTSDALELFPNENPGKKITLSILNEEQQKETKRLELELNKLEMNLNDPTSVVYEECTKLRCNLQLNTEETIARIKIAASVDVNTDECELSSELSNQISEISDQSETMMKKIGEYEKESNSFYKSNKFRKELIAAEISSLKYRIRRIINESNDCSETESSFIDLEIKQFQSKLNCLESGLK